MAHRKKSAARNTKESLGMLWKSPFAMLQNFSDDP